MLSGSNDRGYSTEAPDDGLTDSGETTVVASASTSTSHLFPQRGSTPSMPYLDIPLSSSRRSSHASLDSTFTDLSELSFTSADLQAHQPLINAPAQPPTTIRSRLTAKLHALYVLNYGAILVLLAQFFGTLMSLSTRILEHPGPHGPGMHPFQILFARQSITSLTCTIWALSTGRIPDFPLGPKDMKVRLLLVCRGVCGFLGVFGMYFSLLYLPLSEATVLTFLAPVLTCYLCSWVMPGEAFSRQQQVAGLVSLSGVVFIARPTSFFASDAGSMEDASGGGQTASNSTVPETAPAQGYSTLHPTTSQHLMAIAISLLGVVGSTGAMTSIRAIGHRAHPFLSINYFSVFCTLMSLICLLIFKDVKFRLPGNWTEWGLLASLGACGFVMQWLLTRGLSYGSAGSSRSSETALAERNMGGSTGRSVEQEGIELEEAGEQKPAESGRETGSTKPRSKSYADGKEAPIKGSGNRATSMVYTQMLFALAGDKLVFGVSPSAMSWIGSGLILAGAIWVASARDKDPKIQLGDTRPGLGDGAGEQGNRSTEVIANPGSAAANGASSTLGSGEGIRDEHISLEDKGDRVGTDE